MAECDGPRDRGDSTWYSTLAAPALSPKMVTEPASPPKAAMFSRTHLNKQAVKKNSVGPHQSHLPTPAETKLMKRIYLSANDWSKRP